MTLHLHALSTRHLRGSLALATVVGAGAASLLWGRIGYELLVAAARDAAVLIFILAMLHATSGFDERRMLHKVRHRAPSTLLVAGTAISAALFGIYALMLLATASPHGAPEKTLQLAVALVTTLLSWSLVHLLFALEYAKLFYLHPGRPEDSPPPGGLEFPGGHLPDYADFLYFSFIIGVAAQTADVAITARAMRRRALAHSLIAFLFNTVILAATINIAAGLG
ncbi:MAG: DUF1345 domain-containing protein [Geminicoccaceae bacterium]